MTRLNCTKENGDCIVVEKRTQPNEPAARKQLSNKGLAVPGWNCLKHKSAKLSDLRMLCRNMVKG